MSSTKWTLPGAASWTDVTADAVKEPRVVAYKKSITDGDGRFEATAFSDPSSHAFVMVMTIEVPQMAVSIGDLTAFEAGARNAAKTGGPEVAYTKQIEPTYWAATQRIGAAEPIATRRFEGFLKAGGLRAVSVNCYGDAAVCDPLLASATISTTDLRALSSVDDNESVSYKIGYVLGPILIVLLVIGLARKFQRRASK